MSEQSLQIRAIVMVTIIGVGRGNHVSNAIRRCCAAHGDGNIPRFWPVVYFWKDVGMDVDHEYWAQATPENRRSL
jgi:hypothetical protein